MNLSMNVQYLVNKLGAEEASRLTADAGFDCVDFSLMEMVKPDCVFNSPDWRSAAEEAGKAFRDRGVPVTQTHTPFQFKEFGDPVVYEEKIFPAICRSIEASAALGASIAVVHPLHHLLYAENEELLFQLNMDFYRRLIPVARDCGVKIAVENMWQPDPRRGYCSHDTCSTVSEFCRYVDSLDSEYIVACLDVGHVGLPTQKDEAWDFIRILGHERLKALHIHDNDYKGDLHLPPYSGIIDWDQITKALAEIRYDGEFTYEIGMKRFIGTLPSELYPSALRYLQDIGRNLVRKTEAHAKHGDFT